MVLDGTWLLLKKPSTIMLGANPNRLRSETHPKCTGQSTKVHGNSWHTYKNSWTNHKINVII